MYYGEDIVEEVRRKTDIVDLIGQYVHLKKKGRKLFRPLSFSWGKDPVLLGFSVEADFLLFRLWKGGRQHSLSHGI